MSVKSTVSAYISVSNLVLCAASGIALAAQTAPAMAQNSTSQEIAIEAQPLDLALIEVGRQYGVSVTASSTLTQGKTAPRVNGSMTAEQAIAQLLDGSGLSYRRGANGSFIITQEAIVEQGETRIVVFGQKSVQDIQDVTSSVSITTGEEIEREPLTDLYDIIDRIPNVNRDTQGDILGFAIRGIRETGPARAGNGPLITVFVDGAPLNGAGSGLGPTGAWDLEQVEVYRGPQSTNFGRNTLAGAIYMRTRDPSYDWDAKARAEIGNFGQRWGAIAFGGGIIDDKIAFRVAADYRETEGFTFNPLLGSFNDNTQLWNTRLKLRFDPTEDLSISTTTTYAENLGGPSIVPLPPQVNGELQDPSDQVREAPTDVDSFFQTETFLQAVNIDWEVSDRWSVQSITTYQETDFSSLNDGDLSPVINNISGNANENRTFTQELRIGYSADKLNATFGGFYSNIKSDGSSLLGVNFGPFFGSPIPVFVNQNGVGDSNRDNFALFVDGEYDISDSLSLLFGFRYDDENFTSVNSGSTTADPFPFPPEVPPIANIVLGPLLGTTDAETRSGSYNAALPKAGIRWRPNDDFNIAFVAQRAYRAGGVQTNPADPLEVIPFDPEYLWNYEISSRASFLDGRLTWSNNIFYSKWTDMQVRVFVEGPLGQAGVGFTANAGRAQLFGGETELRFEVNSEVTTYFSAGYSGTEFLEFVNSEFDPDAPLTPQNSPDYNGNEFNSAPEFSFNGGFDYNRPDGFFGGMDFSYQTNAFGTPFNFPESFVGERLLFNARIGYAFTENFTISAIGRNLFDEDYFFQAGRAEDGGQGRLGDPRTWAIRLDARF
ncbi:MAG: TonB-dependent receptor [Pseudomonadota bacterium]